MSLRSARIRCLMATHVLAIFVLAILSQSLLSRDATKTEDPVVKLLEQGSAPRQMLRLVPKRGMKQQSLMKMKIDQAVVMKGQKLPPVPTPAMQFTVEVEITDVATNGDVTFDFTYPKIEVIDESPEPSPSKPLMESMLKSMEGLSGSTTMTSRGFTKKSAIELPPNTAPQITAVMDSMKESINRMGAPLPEEPIGIGGKWSVTQVIEVNGIKTKQTSIHTLKEIKGKTFDIDIELTQSADAQEVKTPGLPQGTTMKLQSLESTGKGTMQFESEAVFPVSRIKSDSKMGMEMITAGQALPMQIEMSLEMTVSAANSSDASK